jgi:hypothetical protein
VAGSAAVQHVLRPLQQFVVNPIVKLAWDLRIPIAGERQRICTGRAG